jgi:hypothetical protein
MRRTLAALALTLFACDKSSPEPKPAEPAPAPASTSSARAASVGSLGISKPAPERIVAIGDLHGDLDAARRALRLAGAIDANDAWIGGKLVVVQTGDLVDRGDGDRQIIDLTEKLKKDAKAAGGEFVALNGNHEIMNAQTDFRYVTRGGFGAFSDIPSRDDATSEKSTDPVQRGRVSAFSPGGVYAKILADRPVVARVGDSIFVHGGVLPKHVRTGLDTINSQTREWLLGERRKPPREIEAEDGPLWTRMYSSAPGKEECATLNETLTLLNAKRMVMGHTPQKPDINPACDEKAWRIDSGMTKFYGGNVEVLEIKGDKVTVLKETGMPLAAPSASH